MRFLLLFSVVLLVALCSVQSAIIYRNGRAIAEVELPREEISNINDEIVPVEFIKDEEILAPNVLKNVDPAAVVVEEPVAVLEVDDPLQIRSNLVENPSVEEVVLVEEIPAVPASKSANLPKQVLEDDYVIDEVEGLSDQDTFNDELSAELPSSPATTTSTSRPTLLQIISNNPFTQFVDTIRGSSTTPRAEADATTPPNFFQQIQTNLQNFGQQIQSAFIPNQNNNASPDTAESAQIVSSTRPPNIIESIQQSINSAVQTVFRPNEQNAVAGTPPPGPFQAVIGFFTGNRQQPQQNAAQVAATPQKSGHPVDDKVDYTLSRNVEEVPEKNKEDDEAKKEVEEPIAKVEQAKPIETEVNVKNIEELATPIQDQKAEDEKKQEPSVEKESS